MSASREGAISDAAHQVNEALLGDWLECNIEGYCGPVTATQFAGGQSNPTYRLITPDRQYVLRKKPPGKLVRGAHAIDREAMVMRALIQCGFPVPRVHAVCLDESLLGTSFYVMDFVEGRIFWDAAFTEVPRGERPRYFDAMNATLARLHGIDFNACGLGSFGRIGNYFERQIARWSKQYFDDKEAGRLESLDRIIEWLPAHIPPGDECSIVHGDFRCDNVVFHPDRPEVIAVLDWELSTLGHPLADFAYHLLMYRLPPVGIAGLVGVDIAAFNIPPEQDYVDAYCRRTDRTGIPALNFYLAFNLFRFAAIVHGIKGRALRGVAAVGRSRDLVAALPTFSQLAWDLANA